ncbi:hypothetical protein NC651_020153 [Populus alba x Populus x berolinensis]|nr:hypothetical protein NC651_020153 [Populus alba x Populus x berolinensis]
MMLQKRKGRRREARCSAESNNNFNVWCDRKFAAIEQRLVEVEFGTVLQRRTANKRAGMIWGFTREKEGTVAIGSLSVPMVSLLPLVAVIGSAMPVCWTHGVFSSSSPLAYVLGTTELHRGGPRVWLVEVHVGAPSAVDMQCIMRVSFMIDGRTEWRRKKC